MTALMQLCDIIQGFQRLCRIGSLANTVMTLAAAVVKQTEGQLDQSASTLQSILVSAADERGEWHLPLTEEQSLSMQQVC